MDEETIYKEIDEFTMGNCIYNFPEKLGLNALKLPNAPGYISVSRGYDTFFIGVGNQADSAMYDWKTKFHGFFQRFEIYGPANEKEEELYEIISNHIDLELYRANRYYTRVEEGTIVGSRFYELFPSSYQLKGSDEIKPVPDYADVDPSFVVLEKGDKFKAVFEYRVSDNKLQKVLYGERV